MIPKVNDPVQCKIIKNLSGDLAALPGLGYATHIEAWEMLKVQEVHDDGFVASNGIKYYSVSYGSSWMDIPKETFNTGFINTKEGTFKEGPQEALVEAAKPSEDLSEEPQS